MAHILIRHKVADFETWKQVYDDHLPAREAAGLENLGLWRNDDDPSEVLILFSASNLAKAKELILTGDHISAQEAYEIGLVNHVVPVDELDAKVAKLCQKLASKGAIALQMAKRAINHGLQTDLKTGLAVEAACFALCYGTEDKQEGTKAFVEKRTPVFKGR